MSIILDDPVNGELEFTKELSSLINRYSWDTKTSTPDYLLAESVLYHLHSLATVNPQLHKWWGASEITDEKRVAGAVRPV